MNARADRRPPAVSGSDRFRTRGQPAALAAVARWVISGAPHAVLLAGPASVGKTTLALDLAAGLLCAAENASDRPCRACRSCRLVDAGTHQDLHRLAPQGVGRQVIIGAPNDPEPGSARELIHELARLPVEGRCRVAIVEGAHRMNEDAQNALLKTLEEPPRGATIVLCADEADRLLPTVRSRAAILRLGPVGPRVIEDLLGERGIDPPRAARLARLAGGRPGRALAYAAAPRAVRAHEEIARVLLDLVVADRTRRLGAGRELLARAAELARLGAEPTLAAGATPGDGAAVAAPGTDGPDEPVGEAEPLSGTGGKAAKASPAERRQLARALLEAWADVARDLAVVATGNRTAVHDPSLLEDLQAAAGRLAPGAAAAFLDRIAQAAELLDANANPELAIDVLVLAWPRAG